MNKPEKEKRSGKQRVIFAASVLMLTVGVMILGYFGIRHIYRIYRRNYLLEHSTVLEIPQLGIKAPVLEGTDNEVLDEAVGHFPDSGGAGSGNYCIAGHSSTIYEYDFNTLSSAEIGMEIILAEKSGKEYYYNVSEVTEVEPEDTWVLNDYGDTRITLITCNDDGSKRIVVTGRLKSEK